MNCKCNRIYLNKEIYNTVCYNDIFIIHEQNLYFMYTLCILSSRFFKI